MYNVYIVQDTHTLYAVCRCVLRSLYIINNSQSVRENHKIHRDDRPRVRKEIL